MSTWCQFIKGGGIPSKSLIMRYLTILSSGILYSLLFGFGFASSSGECKEVFNLECVVNGSFESGIYITETNMMLEKILEIKKCGKKHLVARKGMKPNENDFKNCLVSLKIPDFYELKFEGLKSSDLQNKLDFKKAVKRASDSFCEDLNKTYKRHNDSRNFIRSMASKELKCDEDDVEYYDFEDKNNEYDDKFGESSSNKLFVVSIVLLLLLLLVGMAAYFIYKKWVSKKEMPVEFVGHDFENLENQTK